MDPIGLSEAQKAHFETFGFLALPGLLDDRIDEILHDFEALWARCGGGHNGRPHEGVQRSCLAQFIDRDARLSSLLDDPRIAGLATSLLGTDFNYMGSDGNYYTGDTRWHSDGWHRDLLHIKIAFYLDPLGRDSGCLRVIPGSHRPGDAYGESLQEQVRESAASWGLEPAAVPALALETQPGDIVCFNHNTKHAAFGGSARRRMFTMHLSQRYPRERLQELRDYLCGGARFWVERGYGQAMVETAGPERLVHLEQVLANDGHLAALSARARAEMAEPARG